ncbi:MAG: peroxiredoxin [Leptospiraceae bacterium]|nr:MAG: peroxiredoxin [Leptospiraceae bacterium]
MKIELNQKVPDFELIDDEGNTFRLYDVKEPLLIVFYPGDDTPVCTAQLCDYRDGIDVFRDLGIEVIGISKDSVESHKKFKKKHNLPFRLLSDPEGKVAQMFGCKTLLGTINRAVFLIGRNKELLWYHKETLSLFRRTKEELIEVIKKLKQENKI